MSGPQALNWSDICSYFLLQGFRPRRWEIEALSQLDDAYLTSRLDDKAGKLSNAKALRRTLTGGNEQRTEP